jgi:hypothetical protein
MEKGYEVFRALEPCASCDLIAMKGSEILRIQVRTANVYYKKDGTKVLGYKKAKDATKTDRFAIVIGKEVVYEDSTSVPKD